MMWDGIAEPTRVHTLRAHRGEVVCADMSGALLATGGSDGTLRLWRWHRGSGWLDAGTVTRAHRHGVTVARWASSGRALASTGIDGIVRIWSRTLESRRALVAPAATAARSLCWFGTVRLVVGHDDGTLRVWVAATGRLLTRITQHDGALHALAVMAHGALLLTACTTGTLKVFDLDEVCLAGVTGRTVPAPLLWEDGAHDLGALCADCNDEGDAAATSGHDARVRLWWVADEGGKRIVQAGAALVGHSAAVTALRWARSGELLVSASLDRTARVWAPRSISCVRVLHPHDRYLTCLVLARDLRFLLTGSNDRTVRTWSVSDFTIDDDIEPPCSVISHFALGDLEGIEPVYDEEAYEECKKTSTDNEELTGFNETERAWYSSDEHVGGINCIVATGDLLVTACSDGVVRLFRWCVDQQILVAERSVSAHCYPAQAVDVGARGAVILSAGLDGRARLWDVQSGCELLSLSAECVSGCDTGGGGVRGARLSTQCPPKLLLATDDGVVAIWSLESASPEPVHIYEPFPEAAMCCAWSCDGRFCAAGSAGGELRVLGPPPHTAPLQVVSAAHDLGILSCDFADLDEESETHTYMLASAGRDAFVKIWVVEYNMDFPDLQATLRLVHNHEAHGGAVESVRWGTGLNGTALLATTGADGWARVWSVKERGTSVTAFASVPAGAPGSAVGATAATFLGTTHLATGTLVGELAVWRLSTTHELLVSPDESKEEELAEPRCWSIVGVKRWLTEYITRVPGSPVNVAAEAVLLQRARNFDLRGARLLDEPIEKLLDMLLSTNDNAGQRRDPQRIVPDDHPRLNMESEVNSEETSEDDKEDVIEDTEKGNNYIFDAETNEQLRARLFDELKWLRRGSYNLEMEQCAPHELLCPLTHELLREPARAADGFSYERANLLHHLAIADIPTSPVTGRRMRSAVVSPNYGLRRRLREYVTQKIS